MTFVALWNVTLFGNQIRADVISSDEALLDRRWSGGDAKFNVTGVLIK